MRGKPSCLVPVLSCLLIACGGARVVGEGRRQVEGRPAGRVTVSALPEVVRPYVERLLPPSNDREMENAIRALGELGAAAKDAIPYILDVVSLVPWGDLLDEGDTRDMAVINAEDTLTKIGPAGLPHLIEALATRKALCRYVVVQALGRMGPAAKGAVPALIAEAKRLEDEPNVKLDVSAEAAGALAKIGSPAVPALIELLKQGDISQRQGAAWALGEMGSQAKDAVPLLIKALTSSKDMYYQQAMINALGKIGPPARAAIPALTSALNDPDVQTRAMAKSALEHIQGTSSK
jgi:HEAT repeat protein